MGDVAIPVVVSNVLEIATPVCALVRNDNLYITYPFFEQACWQPPGLYLPQRRRPCQPAF